MYRPTHRPASPPRLLALHLLILSLAVSLGYTAAARQDPPDMVLIPQGEFLMGSPAGTDGWDDERPQRLIYLDAFWIDQYEVTNQAYLAFVTATGHPIPANANPRATLWTPEGPAPGTQVHPVVNVNWTDATTFCRWAGKRLPTEAEWEKAARGAEARRYPWGNSWDWSWANSASYWAGRTVEFQTGDDWNAFWMKGEGARVAREHGIRGEVLTLPVGSFPRNRSPYGAMDMSGNASEWVQDWYDPNYYRDGPQTNPPGPDRGFSKVVRGGSWLKPALSLRTVNRDFGNPESRPSGTGFRCAKDSY